MIIKIQDTRLRNQDSVTLCLLFCLLQLVFLVLCFGSFVLLASVSYAQEENEEEDKITDLPPVKIEIVDTTQLNIPREQFRSFTRPDPEIYAPLNLKERPWYLPTIAIPEKLRDIPDEAKDDFLLLLTASYGAPTMLAYQALAVKGLGKSAFLLDMGRWMPGSDRTAKLVTDVPDDSDGLGKSTIDKFRGAFGSQGEKSSLSMNVQYDTRDLGYLDEDGLEYPSNDRTMADISLAWGQKLSRHARSSLDIGVSDLKMEGPLPESQDDALNLTTDLGLNLLWPGINPIDVGLGVEYLIGEKETEEFKEVTAKFYLKDNYIRFWRFVLGMGMELVFDTRQGASDNADEAANWEPDIYPTPFMLLTSRVGMKTTLQLGAEGYAHRQNLRETYLDKDYVIFNPELKMESGWHLHAALKHKLTSSFTVTVGGFGKEAKDLMAFRETDDDILSWDPYSLEDNVRLFGFSCGWKLLLLNGRLKHSLEYIHESNDQDGHIPYRPMDKGIMSITYLAPFGVEVSLAGKFCGTRYVGINDETLDKYSLWEPRISKTFGERASAFLSATFYAGSDEYQVWRKYGLPRRMLDFGLTLRY